MLYRILKYASYLLFMLTTAGIVGITCLMAWVTVRANIHYLWIWAGILSVVADIVVLTPWALQFVLRYLFRQTQTKPWPVKEACKNWGGVFIALWVLLSVGGFLYMGLSYFKEETSTSLPGFLQYLTLQLKGYNSAG